MNKDFENSIKEKFDHFDAGHNPALFDQIIAKRNKRKAAAIWITRLKWSAAVILLLSSLIYIINQNSATDPKVEVSQNSSDLNNQQPEQSNQIDSEESNISTPDLETQASEQNTAEVQQSANQQTHSSVSNHNNLVIVDETEDETVEGVVYDDNIQPNVIIVEEEGGPENVTPTADNGDEIVEDEGIAINDAPETVGDENNVDEDNVTEIETNTTASTQPDTTVKAKGGDLVGPGFISSGFSIDVLWGAGYSNRTLSGNQELMMLRNATESPRLSQSLEIGINYQMNEKWSVRSGLRYMERNEAFNYSNSEEVHDSTISSRVVTIYHPVNPPQYITVYDTAVEVYTVVDNQNSFNTYRYFSIPLEVERKFYFGNKWTFMGKTGLMFSVYSSQQGLRQVSENQNVSLESLESRKIGTLSASLGLGAAYRMNDRIQLIAYPQFFYTPTSNSNLGLNESEIGAFGSFGLRIEL